MSTLKVGDRVAVYGWVMPYGSPYKARKGGRGIITWTSKNSIHIRFDVDPITDQVDKRQYPVDVKQCRRLVKKAPRRRIYLPEVGSYAGDLYGYCETLPKLWEYLQTKGGTTGIVEFLEVRRKK